MLSSQSPDSASLVWWLLLVSTAFLSSLLIFAKICFARSWYLRLAVLRWNKNSSQHNVQPTLVLSRLPLGSFLKRSLPWSKSSLHSALYFQVYITPEPGRVKVWWDRRWWDHGDVQLPFNKGALTLAKNPTRPPPKKLICCLPAYFYIQGSIVKHCGPKPEIFRGPHCQQTCQVNIHTHSFSLHYW